MVRDDRNALSEMHETADSIHITNTIQALVDITADKNITREKRFDHSHNAALGRTLHPQPRVKYLQAEISFQTGRHDMLMFRFSTRAIPGERSHLQRSGR